MDQSLLDELQKHQEKLLGVRQMYEDDGTIPQDERDYLESVLNKFPDSLWAEEEDEATDSGSGIANGTLMAAPGAPSQKKKPFKRIPFRPKAPKPPDPAPVYPQKGLGDPIPEGSNPMAGLRLWNFEDGKSTLYGQHERALKSVFLGSRMDLTKLFEVVGYTSGIGLDTAGGAKLATARARAARDFLIKNGWKKDNFARTLGIAAKKALKTDMKDGKPWPEGAARNRRVEIRPTNNLIIIPDEVVDDAGGRGDISDDPGLMKDINVGSKLPDGTSDRTEMMLTMTDFTVSVITEILGSIGAGAFGAISSGIINYAQIIDAWDQAQKGANRQGAAFGFKIGAEAAAKLISAGNEVADIALWNMVKGQAKTFGNRRIPVDWSQVETAISEGVEKCAYVVRGVMIDTEKQFKAALDKKLSPRNSGLVYTANIRMIRTKVAEEFAKQMTTKVNIILSSKP